VINRVGDNAGSLARVRQGLIERGYEGETSNAQTLGRRVAKVFQLSVDTVVGVLTSISDLDVEK
jgi:hypothetical protein